MKKRFLECGKIVATHGLRGEVKVLPWCDGPEALVPIKTFYLDGGNTPKRAERCRIQKNMVLLKLEGEEDTLEEGQYYIQDLIGLTVEDADTGEVYGTLRDVTETGANDVYHVAFPDGRVQLIPAIPQVIVEIDIDGGKMLIRPLEGLFV